MNAFYNQVSEARAAAAMHSKLSQKPTVNMKLNDLTLDRGSRALGAGRRGLD